MNFTRLYNFIEECCLLYEIDDSHGLKHSKGCVSWVEKLLAEEKNVTDDERLMAIYSAALHDMCDKKYTDPTESSARIRTWLIGEGWRTDMADALIRIINTMSYSMLKKENADAKRPVGKPVFPDHGLWTRAYHLARHADLLDAYIVGRCFLYTQHIFPDIHVEECWEIVEKLFVDRVYKYVSDGWIFMPLAIQYAEDLEVNARLTFSDRICDY
jgi:hypothetical protein